MPAQFIALVQYAALLRGGPAGKPKLYARYLKSHSGKARKVDLLVSVEVRKTGMRVNIDPKYRRQALARGLTQIDSGGVCPLDVTVSCPPEGRGPLIGTHPLSHASWNSPSQKLGHTHGTSLARIETQNLA